MNRTNFYVLLFILAGPYIKAQTFLYEGPVKGIKATTLYKIPLNYELKKHTSKDFHDLRILDSANREVPYVILSEPLVKEKQDFVPYEIVSQKHFKDYSEILIKNSAKDKISNIGFNIINSDAYKYCSIEGSDDTLQWFSVSALQELSLAYNENYTNSYKCIYFPLTEYLYYRLKVEDWHAEPLKINSAGYFKNSVIAGKLEPVAFKTMTKEDAEKKITSIRLSFENNQEVNRIDFKIRNPRLYLRHALIYVNKTEQQKHKTIHYKDILFEFDLSSEKLLLFDIPAINETEIFIEIENKDNPPLNIESISCKQLASYLICDFDSLNTYTLKCGNLKLKSPEYDLGNFVSTIPQLMPEASVRLTEIPIVKPLVIEKPKSFFETKNFLWLCLVLGALVIIIFSVALLKDMGKKMED